MNIGTNIIILRAIEGLKQGELASEVGVTQNYISLLETNKKVPSLTLLQKMAGLYNYPMTFFFQDFKMDTKLSSANIL